MKFTSKVALIFFILMQVSVAGNTKVDFNKIEVIKGKTQEKTVEIAKKTFHGKVVKTHVTKKINAKSAIGNKEISDYLKYVATVVMDHKQTSKKFKKLKLKGVVSAKIQIQKDGNYDVLFIQGANLKLQKFTESIFESINNFKALPAESGVTELQIQIPVNLNFSK